MSRVLIHPGFHKTGTTSIQSTLKLNADRLAPHLRIVLRDDMSGLTDACRSYSKSPKPRRLDAVLREAIALFDTLEPSDPRPVLISSEDLSGLLPGRQDVLSYAAAPALMAAIGGAAEERFGDWPTFVFTTRDPAGWLGSSWWQHLRSTRMTDDLDAWSDRAAEAAQLDLIVAATSEAVPDATVIAAPLAEAKDLPEGPLSPLLDLLDLPPSLRGTLEIAPRANATPSVGLEPIFLALNRSGLPDAIVGETKRMLLRKARKIDG
ncbi:hypothetical protein [Litorisediminicola beolgyonensis]|uniref:Sulfotransferase family protein n=1 Tax=Litorisediminicola beolgyonensis TaxID=1173614 RepID=A0ABW3ZNB5_9RHOB